MTNNWYDYQKNLKMPKG